MLHSRGWHIKAVLKELAFPLVAAGLFLGVIAFCAPHQIQNKPNEPIAWTPPAETPLERVEEKVEEVIEKVEEHPEVLPQHQSFEDYLTESADFHYYETNEKLNWRKSVIDLLETVEQDSSFAARRKLAREYGLKGHYRGTERQNNWLRDQVFRAFKEHRG